jgi:hypothetical protein
MENCGLLVVSLAVSRKREMLFYVLSRIEHETINIFVYTICRKQKTKIQKIYFHAYKRTVRESKLRPLAQKAFMQPTTPNPSSMEYLICLYGVILYRRRLGILDNDLECQISN